MNQQTNQELSLNADRLNLDKILENVAFGDLNKKQHGIPPKFTYPQQNANHS